MFFAILAVVVLGLFLYEFKKKKKYPVQFALICAGIIGNLTDRIFHGHVIDFIDFNFWPVFNVSDAAISIGMAWLIFILIKTGEDIF
jgi:signal peptidase II